MRKCLLGAQPLDVGLRPKFAKRPRPEKQAEVSGQQKTSVMSYFPSWKGGRRMEKLRHYSHIHLATVLEVDPEVERWTTDVQPIEYIEDGKPHTYTANFWCLEPGGIRVIRILREETKPESKGAEQHRRVRAEYGTRGIFYEVVTEDEVATDPRLRAAQHILFHRYWDVPESLALDVASMSSNPPATLGALHIRLGGRSETWPQLLSLVAQGFVDVDLGTKLGPEMSVIACKMKGIG